MYQKRKLLSSLSHQNLQYITRTNLSAPQVQQPSHHSHQSTLYLQLADTTLSARSLYYIQPTVASSADFLRVNFSYSSSKYLLVLHIFTLLHNLLLSLQNLTPFLQEEQGQLSHLLTSQQTSKLYIHQPIGSVQNKAKKTKIPVITYIYLSYTRHFLCKRTHIHSHLEVSNSLYLHKLYHLPYIYF